MVICHCNAVNDTRVIDEIARGATTIDEIVESCDAGGGCHGCHERLEEMLATAEAATLEAPPATVAA